jgi:hypothetical protein
MFQVKRVSIFEKNGWNHFNSCVMKIDSNQIIISCPTSLLPIFQYQQGCEEVKILLKDTTLALKLEVQRENRRLQLDFEGRIVAAQAVQQLSQAIPRAIIKDLGGGQNISGKWGLTR